jgi:hypothetical protein
VHAAAMPEPRPLKSQKTAPSSATRMVSLRLRNNRGSMFFRLRYWWQVLLLLLLAHPDSAHLLFRDIDALTR